MTSRLLACFNFGYAAAFFALAITDAINGNGLLALLSCWGFGYGVAVGTFCLLQSMDVKRLATN